MLKTALSRRQFSRWLAASPLVAAVSQRAWASWDNVESPPVFGTIVPPRIAPQPEAAQLFAPAEVKLLEGPFRLAQAANASYMQRLDTDRLLHNFRVNAGIPSSAEPLGGWEKPDCELRGHFVGHYMSGAALQFAASGEREFRDRGNRIVTGLAECQAKLGTDGYLSAFPRSYFDRLAAGTNVWAPFYTIHKIFAGLIDMHEHAGNAQALDVARGVANWADQWTAARDESSMQKVLEVEFGGMNDALYRLAAITRDARWMAVGDRFTKKRVFEPLAAQKDALHGLHMNTHVPQVIGAERRYELTGDNRFRDVSQFFWQTVTGVRTYATGGSSNNEHWLTEPHLLGLEWASGHDHQECCCSYNMLKLGRMLFTRNPQAAIADYYERALLNHRLGEIHPETGNSSYFLSLSPGAWKTWGTDTTTFWCCNGTALEDFASFNRMIYAHDSGGIWVNLFIPSTLDWAARGVRLRQETVFPAEPRAALIVEASGRDPWTLRLRIPRWAGSGVAVTINGRPVDAMAQRGSYLELTRAWLSGDRIEIALPMQARWEAFGDLPEVAALVYGPVVLAQQHPLGDVPADLMHEQGPKLEMAPASELPAALPRDLPARLRPIPGKPLHFTGDIEGRSIEFRPINDSWERYSVYSPIA